MSRSTRAMRVAAVALAAVIVAYFVALRIAPVGLGPVIAEGVIAVVICFSAAVLAAHALPADSRWWLRIIIALAGLLLASLLAWITFAVAPYFGGLYLAVRLVVGLFVLGDQRMLARMSQ